MFLSCFFIRKNNSFVLNKIYTNLSQVCFLLILIIHFEVRFFISVMLNVYMPFPIFITLLGQGSFFLLKRGLSVLSSKGFVCFVLMSNVVIWEVIQDLYFHFKVILSTLLFNIKIPQVSFLILFHSFISLLTRIKVVPFSLLLHFPTQTWIISPQDHFQEHLDPPCVQRKELFFT